MRAGAGMAATAIASPAIAQTAAPVRWRLATSWPKSLDTLYGGVDAMCQRVGQITDKKFQIQCFAGGEIVPPLQVWDATQNGTVECGHTLTSFNIGKNPAVAFDSGLAFGLNTRQQQAWMNYGGGLELSARCSRRTASCRFPAAMSACRWVASTARRSTRSTTSKGSSSGSADSAA
jgi:TRAP-type mannitol/chloroaromatic compound transport system substrate-binding protein